MSDASRAAEVHTISCQGRAALTSGRARVNRSLSQALAAFRVVLGASLLYGSAATAIAAGVNAAVNHAGRLPVLLLASVEAVGALLLLLPRTRQPGAVLLILTIGLAFMVHLVGRDFRPDLLVYLAGVALVAVHDRSTRTGSRAAATAA